MTDRLAEQARFLHEPRTEQEVVCLFVALLDEVSLELGFPFLIETVETGFPDCTIRRLDTEERLYVEFELNGIDFLRHRSRPERCDVLVCWRDDWDKWECMPELFRVVQLADTVKTRQGRQPPLIATITDSPLLRWDEQTFLNQALTDRLPEEDLELVREIIQLSAKHGLGPRWLKGRRGVFAVGDHRQFFKVWSNGDLAFPFSRLETEHFDALAARLNRVLPGTRQLGSGDAGSKGKGDRISVLFRKDQLGDFFDVWLWFRDLT